MLKKSIVNRTDVKFDKITEIYKEKFFAIEQLSKVKSCEP